MIGDKEFESTLLEHAVTELSRLPGIGRKTALRLALHLLRGPEERAVALGQSIIDMRKGVGYCPECHNISETGLCRLCADKSRDHATVCVVETVKDVMAIEATGGFNGVYHVLGGLISPMEGMGPDSIEIASLVDRVAKGGVDEVILALSATMEGDTTTYYIYRQLTVHPEIKITQLARGVAVGNEIEYTDEVTLARSIENRTLFSDSFRK